MGAPPASVYLASRSPRRRALLAQLGVTCEVLVPDVDESARDALAPARRVVQLARDKAAAGWHCAQRLRPIPVLAADTLIELDGNVLGKPRDRGHALAMLRALCGREHRVHTGVAVLQGSRCLSRHSVSRVRLRRSTAAEREAYWRSGEPADKAGAYAVQGLGAVLVSSLEGSYSGVVGLPLYETAALLAEFGVDVLGVRR